MKLSNIFGRASKVLAVARVISEGKGLHHAVWYVLCDSIKSLGGLIYSYYLLLYSRTRNKLLIHVIGDSHVKVFRRNLPFVAHHIGAATAYNLKKKNSAINSNEKLFNIISRIGKKDTVILAFGEIDCRIHAYYQFRKNDEKYTISEILDMTVSNYGEVIEQVRALGVNPCVYSVPPATMVGNEYNFPYYATPEMRGEITRMFNEKLKEFCKRNDYVYIDVYSKVCDEKGLMLKEYAADKIHLNSKALDFVKMEINEKLGISF